MKEIIAQILLTSFRGFENYLHQYIFIAIKEMVN
jgi:hypothetical protein